MDTSSAHIVQQAPGPSTPRPRRTAAPSLDESYFDGVPGAPARKLRSQPAGDIDDVYDDKNREQRRSKAKSVAKLIDFSKEGKDDPKAQSSSCSNSGSRRPLRHCQIPRSDEYFQLEPPLALRRSPRRPSISPTLKRSYSASTSADDLMHEVASRSPKVSRTSETTPTQQSDDCRKGKLKHGSGRYDTDMRRAVSASSRFDVAMLSRPCTPVMGSSWANYSGPSDEPTTRFRSAAPVHSTFLTLGDSIKI